MHVEREGRWYPWEDSNLQPRAPQARVLSTELQGHIEQLMVSGALFSLARSSTLAGR